MIFPSGGTFLNCSESLRQSELYRNDAIEFAAFYLGAKADLLYVKALEMKRRGIKRRRIENWRKLFRCY